MRRSVLGSAAIALLAGCAHAGPGESGGNGDAGYAVAHPRAQAAKPDGSGVSLIPASAEPAAIATRRPLPDEGRSYEPAFAGGVIAGCPPGMARSGSSAAGGMDAECAAPADSVDRSGFHSPSWWCLAKLGGGRFVSRGGYLLRLGEDGRIGGYVPLLGGALSVGEAWPNGYRSAALPHYYESYFGLGREASYRYANNVIYRVDPGSKAIMAVAALLASDGFVIGRPVPAGYDVYNVPQAYRERFPDHDDAWYRYSDGHIYTVDPQTRLVIAANPLMDT